MSDKIIDTDEYGIQWVVGDTVVGVHNTVFWSEIKADGEAVDLLQKLQLTYGIYNLEYKIVHRKLTYRVPAWS